jgi:Glycosyltransferase family 28 C-terminal domain
VIGFYVHHVGRGHLQQALSVAAQLPGGVTGLSSLAEPDGWPGEWVILPRDDTALAVADPQAGGQLHWAPLSDPGLRGRMAAIAAWIQDAAPAAMMVDVSVEVSALARLMGVPVVVPLLPGSRADPAHTLGYALADVLLAPWPEFMAPALLPDVQQWQAKIRHVGAFSRFDGREPEPRDGAHRATRRVLVMQGCGGSGITAGDLRQAVASTPGWTWEALGGAGGRWADDPWPALCRADVVVAHAGLSAIAEIAAARKPAVILPQARPHGEQTTTARALAAAGLAVTATSWPRPGRWPALIESALETGGSGWQTWSSGTGARQAAEVIESVAARLTRSVAGCAAQS